ncbi:hypothetical protein Peur_029720 [Populus x canadensis]
MIYYYFAVVPPKSKLCICCSFNVEQQEKNLQDPSDRRNINCEKPLQALFGVDSIKMFQMTKREKEKHKGGNSGFLAPLQHSYALIKLLGTGKSSLSRSDVVKRIWECIKQNNLQDPSDKRRIPCDVKLKELFDIDCSKTLFRSFCEDLTVSCS